MFNDTQHDHSDDLSSHSNLAYICEQAKLHGIAPEPGEYDPREIWEREVAIGSMIIAFDVLARDIGPTGFQLADETDSLLCGFVNLFDQQIRRIDGNIDRYMPELQDLQREQDGSEIKSHELEWLTHRVQCLTSRRDAFELRDRAAELCLEATGSVWRPRFGSATGSMPGSACPASSGPDSSPDHCAETVRQPDHPGLTDDLLKFPFPGRRTCAGFFFVCRA